MKNFFFISGMLLLCLGILPASAQKIGFGIKAGYNAANWDGNAMQNLNSLVQLSNGYSNTQMRPGFHAGGYLYFPVTHSFSIEPGAYYSQKGMRINGEFSSEKLDFLNLKATITNKADYIDVPLLAKVFVADGLHLYGGPQVSFLVSNKINLKAGALGFNVLDTDFDYDNPFRKTDFGIVGGVGYRFSNGLNLSAGYDYGLNTVDKNATFDIYNRVIKASVGFEF